MDFQKDNHNSWSSGCSFWRFMVAVVCNYMAESFGYKRLIMILWYVGWDKGDKSSTKAKKDKSALFIHHCARLDLPLKVVFPSSTVVMTNISGHFTTKNMHALMQHLFVERRWSNREKLKTIHYQYHQRGESPAQHQRTVWVCLFLCYHWNRAINYRWMKNFFSLLLLFTQLKDPRTLLTKFPQNVVNW